MEFRRIAAVEALALIFAACDRDQAYSLFDTRDAESYARSHIPTAQLLAERDVGHWAKQLDQAQLLLIYCYHGHSSQLFARTFAAYGFSQVYSIDGGFEALVQAFQSARQAAHSHD